VIFTVEIRYRLAKDPGLACGSLLLHGEDRESSGLSSAIRSKETENLVLTNPKSVASHGRKHPDIVVLLVEVINMDYKFASSA
jgi:hypothetical protein